MTTSDKIPSRVIERTLLALCDGMAKLIDNVLVMEDNDDAGREKAAAVARVAVLRLITSSNLVGCSIEDQQVSRGSLTPSVSTCP